MIENKTTIDDTTHDLVYTTEDEGEIRIGTIDPTMGNFYFVPNIDFSSEYPYKERNLFTIENRARVTNVEQIQRMGLAEDSWPAENFVYSSINLKGEGLDFVVDKHAEKVGEHNGEEYWNIYYDFNVSTPMAYDPYAETTYYSAGGEEALLIPKTTAEGKGELKIRPVLNILDSEGNDYFREFVITIEMTNEKPLIGEEGKYDLVYQGWDER